MSKVFWIPLFLSLIAGSVKAKEIQSSKNEGVQFGAAESIDQDKPIPNSNSASEYQTASADRAIPLTGKEKLHYTMRSTYDASSILFTCASAGMKQAADSVPEWGQGMEGYGKRMGSAFGQRNIKRYLQFGVGSLLHEDPRYFASEHSGIWRRSLYAASRAFVSNKDGGGIRPGYSRFIGAFGAAYISRQWYPENKQTASEYLTVGAISIGTDVAKSIFNEFWPDVKRLLHR